MAIKFLNVGEDPTPNPDPLRWVGRRQWDACRKYHFVSAGQGEVYSSQLGRLNVGDLVAAFITKRGYVGVGRVMERCKPIAQFDFDGLKLKDFNIPISILKFDFITTAEVPERPPLRQILFANAYNKKTEYAVAIDWEREVDCENAKWKPGLFANPNIVCSLDRQSDTVDFLESEFSIRLK